MSPKNPFASLVGEELNTVAFVMDYVEFHFNGPRVRALTNPIVRTTAGEIQFPAPGSRDALCSLIGQEVRGASLRDEHSLEFSFNSGAALIIPLDPGSYIGPEALHWHPDYDNRNMVIW
jgi:hypothetical protein